VDEVSDTAEVLQAVLEPRGLTVNRVRRLDSAASAGDARRPAVVVLDIESLDGNCPSACKVWQGVPLVIIGTVQSQIAGNFGLDECSPSSRHLLQKPFQFPELVAAIESMVAASQRCQ
jgi:DNA-binding response OmpR family regulator